MFGTFYLATYKKEYKLPHVKLATKELENHPHSLSLKLCIQSGTFLWKICTRELVVHQVILQLLDNLRGVRESESAPSFTL